MKDIRQELIDKARELGICKDGFSDMNHGDLDFLVEYYIAHPDWCMERDYPTLPYLQDNFDAKFLEDKGVYVGKTFNGEVLDDKQVYILHKCNGWIRTRLNVNKELIPMFYFANDCDIYIDCESNIKIPLYIVQDGRNRITHSASNDSVFKRYKISLINHD